MAHTIEQASAFEAAGRRLASALDAASAVIVAGRDADDAARVALGLAAGQSVRRRVAVADLAGDTPALQRLVPDDDPHGLSDSFLYGVSLNRVARQQDDEGRLFVVPGGTEPPIAAGVLADERWARLVGDFWDVGALLLVVAPSDAPGLDALAHRLDGVIAADRDPVTQALPRLLATADLAPPAEARAPAAAMPVALPPEPAAAPAPRPTRPKSAPVPEEPPARRLHPALIALAGVVVIAILVFAARWIGGACGDGTPLFGSERRGEGDAVAAAPPAAPADSASPSDSVGTPADSLAGAASLAGAGAAPAVPTPAPAAEAPLPVANPRDLARASAFAVVLSSFRSESLALARFRDRPRNLAGVTVAHDPATGMYHVVTGADRARGTATAQALRLRSTGVASASAADTVMRLPYAIQVESGVPIAVRGVTSYDSLRTVLNSFLARGFPAYAVTQGGNRASIYVGAFADPADARPVIAKLQAAGLPAALVVRTGRAL